MSRASATSDSWFEDAGHPVHFAEHVLTPASTHGQLIGLPEASVFMLQPGSCRVTNDSNTIDLFCGGTIIASLLFKTAVLLASVAFKRAPSTVNCPTALSFSSSAFSSADLNANMR